MIGILKQPRLSRWIPGIVLAAVLITMVGCSGGGSSGTPDLFLVSFQEDQRTNLYRDQVIVFQFTTTVDPGSVELDTFQIFTGTTQNPVPFTGGWFEISGTYVRYHPVWDEDLEKLARATLPAGYQGNRSEWTGKVWADFFPETPAPLTKELNPYGFDENTTYQVKIPSIAEIPTPLKVIKDKSGRPIIQSFSGVFSTGKDYTPNPSANNPMFEANSYAVHNDPNALGTTTPDPNDDILWYVPVPNTATPPSVPNTNPPVYDYRRGHPTNVRVQVTFTEVMDPRSFRSQDSGNIIMEYNSPNSQDWNFIPTVISHAKNGRTFILEAATPLAHATRYNKYRLVVDQTTYPILSRDGKKLIEVVEKWNSTQNRIVRSDVVEADLTMWCGMVPGETGPLLTASFPFEIFTGNTSDSDTDITFGTGELKAGNVTPRLSDDSTPCALPGNGCSLALREPLTQDPSSAKPNPNPKGPSKIQFHFNSFQHAATPPNYKLKNAEALVGMNWGPLCNTVIKATYPKMHIHVMWSDRDSTQASAPESLPSTTYNSNFDKNPPGFPVRDGTQPYQITQSSASTTWYPWKFQQPFTDYRVDKGLVFMAWTEVGGDVEQYMIWYSPAATPNTRMYSPPSTAVNPSVGLVGQFCYYWTQFEFKRMRSLAITKFFRMTQNNNDKPLWNTVVVSPLPANLPGGTSYKIMYRGGIFPNYVPKTAGGKTYYMESGTLSSPSAWSTNISNMNLLPAVAIRVEFTANIDKPADLPFLDGLSFTFQLKS